MMVMPASAYEGDCACVFHRFSLLLNKLVRSFELQVGGTTPSDLSSPCGWLHVITFKPIAELISMLLVSQDVFKQTTVVGSFSHQLNHLADTFQPPLSAIKLTLIIVFKSFESS
jgi:hypothetical protein